MYQDILDCFLDCNQFLQASTMTQSHRMMPHEKLIFKSYLSICNENCVIIMKFHQLINHSRPQFANIIGLSSITFT